MRIEHHEEYTLTVSRAEVTALRQALVDANRYLAVTPRGDIEEGTREDIIDRIAMNGRLHDQLKLVGNPVH